MKWSNQRSMLRLLGLATLVVVVLTPMTVFAQTNEYTDMWTGDDSDEDDGFDMYGAGVTDDSYTSGEVLWTETTLYAQDGTLVADNTSDVSYTFARADVYRWVSHDENMEFSPPANCSDTCHWRAYESHIEHPWCNSETMEQIVVRKFTGRYLNGGIHHIDERGKWYTYDALDCFHVCMLASAVKNIEATYLVDVGTNIESSNPALGACRHRFKASTVRPGCAPPH
jgi:hypothetical protein